MLRMITCSDGPTIGAFGCPLGPASAPSRAPTLHLLDSALCDKAGHHFEYDRAVCAEWVGRGGGAQVYARGDVEGGVAALLGAKPCFRLDTHFFAAGLGPWGSIGQALNLWRVNRVFLQDLRNLGTAPFWAADVALVHTIGPNQLFGLHRWHRRLPRECRPALVVLLRYGLGDTPRMRRANRALYRAFFRLWRRPGGAPLALASDSRLLADDYAALAGRPVHVLPIPHLPDAGGVGETPGGLGAGEGTVFAFLGPPREEKGFLLLPEAAEAVLRRRKDVTFLVQANGPGALPSPLCDARDRLAGLGARVTLVDRVMDSEAYYAAMRSSDVVLVPYAPETYRGRTSGILAEAVALAKPVVVTRGTWMAEEVERLGGGRILLDGFDAASLARAIEEAAHRIGELRARAADAAREWRRVHNPRSFVDRLLAAVGRTSPLAEESGG